MICVIDLLCCWRTIGHDALAAELIVYCTNLRALMLKGFGDYLW